MINRILFLAIAVLMSGCTSRLSGDVSKHFQFDQNDNRGLVAATFQCQVMPGEMDVSFHSMKNNQSYFITTPCNYRGVDQEAYLKIMKLPAGLYEINAIEIFNLDRVNVSVKDLTPIQFWVSPERVTYIGRIVFEKSEDLQIRVGVEAKEKADLPVIRGKLPLLQEVVVRHAYF